MFKSEFFYIILIVLLLFFYGLFLFFINRSLRKKNAEINRQNNDINLLYEKLGQHLKSREALYQELHHRVVSDLALIKDAFINYRFNTTNPVILEMLESSIVRLSSIIKVHQLVFAGSDKQVINGRQYLQSVGSHVLDLQQKTNRAAFALVCPDELMFNPRFTQFFGMIFSELLMNSMKHARVGPGELRITLELITDENHLRVTYLDNGKPQDGGEADPGTGESTGFYLIRTLTKQLSGDCLIDMKTGFMATFMFKKNSLVA